jgi:hypothetical protein
MCFSIVKSTIFAYLWKSKNQQIYHKIEKKNLDESIKPKLSIFLLIDSWLWICVEPKLDG